MTVRQLINELSNCDMDTNADVVLFMCDDTVNQNTEDGYYNDSCQISKVIGRKNYTEIMLEDL